MKNQPAHCTACSDLPGQAFKADTAPFKVSHYLHQARQATPDARDDPAATSRNVASSQHLEARFLPQTGGRPATGRFLIN